ncbi:MAG: hypothetical protein PHQ57_03035 [Candidatus Omnitrophica bacterium]|nr:hypothetical protein [Candidatus Omnitrophota bacterium]
MERYQNHSFEQGHPYPDLRMIIQGEPSLEERAALYNEAEKIIYVLGCFGSVVLAAAVPFKNISFGAFVVIFFVSRCADILSTIFCLRMPWAFETNPHSQARRLSLDFILKYAVNILFCAGFVCLLSLWFSVFAKVILLTHAMAGFLVSVSNLYQTFAMVRANKLFYVISNSAIGVGVFFLLRFLI